MSIFYTLQPIEIPTINTTSVIVMSFVVGIAFAMLTNLFCFLGSAVFEIKYFAERPTRFWVELFGVAFFGWFALSSFVLRDQQLAYVNQYTGTPEKLVGTLKGFIAERNVSISGKSKTENHFLYVVYNVNGGDILFRATTGISYPQQAIIYANTKVDKGEQ